MKSKVLLAALTLLAITNTSAQDRALSFNWESVGPTNVSSKSSSILVSKLDPESKTLILGSESNGIFRSTNKGSNWQKINVSGMSQYISGLHQASDGKIFTSTGIIPNFTSATVPYQYNKAGNGIWVSSDGGLTYTQLSSTIPSSISPNDKWASINKVITDPANSSKIYAGTNTGFQLSSDGGNTWSDPIGLTLPVSDIDVGNNGQLIVSYITGDAKVSLDGGLTYTTIIGTNAGQIADANNSKTEFAISSANNNFVYACAIKSDGFISGIYKSSDKGLTWTLFTNGSTFFAEALSGSGLSNSFFEVIPGETDRLVLAGSFLYTYSPSESWIRRLSRSYGGFVSAAWDPKNKDNFYVTTNSGVYRTYTGVYQISSMQSINAGISSPDISHLEYSAQYTSLVPAQVNFRFTPRKDTTYSFTINQKINSNGDSSVLTFSYKSVASSNNETEIKTNFLNQITAAVNAGNLFVTVDTSDQVAGDLRILITAFKTQPEFIVRGFRNLVGDFTRVTYASSNPTLFATTQFVGAYYLDNLSSGNKIGKSLNTGASISGILAGISKTIFDAGTYGEVSVSADLGENWSGGENVLSGALWSVGENFVGTATFSNTKTPITYSEKQNSDFTFTQRMAIGSNVEYGTATNTTITQNKPTVWVSKTPLNGVPTWLRVAGNNYSKPDKLIGIPIELKFTHNQDYLFVSTNDGTNTFLYRVSIPNNLIKDSVIAAYNSPSNLDPQGVPIRSLSQMDSLFTDIRSNKTLVRVNKIGNFGSRSITSLSVDPNDQSKLLVTLGSYGFNDYLYLSNNADSCAGVDDISNFTSVQGNLIGVPVKESVIDVFNGNTAFITTEEGLYFTENLDGGTNSIWTLENSLPAKITTCITQVTNDYFVSGDKGNLYVGTIGKGAYVSKASTRVSANSFSKTSTVKVYPNPSKGTFTVSSEKEFNQIIVRNITGQVVFNKALNTVEKNNIINLDIADGVYVYEVLNNSTRVGSGKVLISK